VNPCVDYSAAVASLTSLTKQRLLLGEKVAAAKYGTGQPIEDPEREAMLLHDVAERSERIGLDPAVSTCYFRNQIEASKRLQRRLYARWRTCPDARPRRRPDLATEVRPELDHLTREILCGLKTVSQFAR
jgi:chorismate mutase